MEDFVWPSTAAGNTLLIANTGLHTPELEDFQSDIDIMLELLQTAGYRSSYLRHDLLVFRTTVPGHLNCMTHTKLFRSPPSDFILVEKFRWANMPSCQTKTPSTMAHFGRLSHDYSSAGQSPGRNEKGLLALQSSRGNGLVEFPSLQPALGIFSTKLTNGKRGVDTLAIANQYCQLK